MIISNIVPYSLQIIRCSRQKGHLGQLNVFSAHIKLFKHVDLLRQKTQKGTSVGILRINLLRLGIKNKYRAKSHNKQDFYDATLIRFLVTYANELSRFIERLP